MTTQEIKALAKNFLQMADELNELVSDYINGSNESNAVHAYFEVKRAEESFVDAVNDFYGIREYEACLNYELAEAWAE